MTTAVFAAVPVAMLLIAHAMTYNKNNQSKRISLSFYNFTNLLQIAILAYVRSGESGPIGVQRLSFAVFGLHVMRARKVNNIGRL